MLITIHLYLASFLAAPFLLMIVSGGLYLFGIKGSVESTVIHQAAGNHIDLASDNVTTEVRALLEELNIEHEFEYLKSSGHQVITRPTSRQYYVIKQNNRELTVSRQDPSLQARMIELHKGHGPGLFRTLQKILAVGLLIVILSGLWLGIANRGSRTKSLTALAAGTVLFILLILI